MVCAFLPSIILVEKCIAGWKEIEYEVMRDHKGSVITVCAENLDPWVSTPATRWSWLPQTLTEPEYPDAAYRCTDIITEAGHGRLQLPGFAWRADSFVRGHRGQPRVRSPHWLPRLQLPHCQVATHRHALDEITNDVTSKTCACFEPALDYIVVKVPEVAV